MTTKPPRGKLSPPDILEVLSLREERNARPLPLRAHDEAHHPFEVQGTLAYTSVLTPPDISATQNDYNPVGLQDTLVLRLDPTVDVTITGLQGGYDGRVLVIQNIDASFTVTLTAEDVGSAAPNRFAARTEIKPGEGTAIIYDADRKRWIPMHVFLKDHDHSADTSQGGQPLRPAGDFALISELAALGLTNGGTTHNYFPAGLDSNTLISIGVSGTGGTHTITGLDATWAEDGQIVFLSVSDSTDTITLKHRDAGSLGGNQFSMATGEDYVMKNGTAVMLVYHDSKWQVIGLNAQVVTHTHQSASTGGTLDHGLALTGLADDDHTQYLKEETSGGLASEVPDHTHVSAAEAGIIDTFAEDFNLTGDISPAQITADQNDYNPAGLGTASILRLTSDAARSITGLAGGADGRVIVILNVGSFTITLVDESASSLAANRFALDANVAVSADTAAVLIYDSTSSRWRLVSLGKASAAGSNADVQIFTANGTWTKPSGGQTMGRVIAIGGGGGGGSGERRASGVAAGGGGGGGGSAYVERDIPLSVLAATEAVVVGAGGAGAAANSTNGSDGTAGAAGGASTFAAGTAYEIQAPGGNGGGGGSAGIGGTGGSGGGSASGTGTASAYSKVGTAGGDGGGGSTGAAADDVPFIVGNFFRQGAAGGGGGGSRTVSGGGRAGGDGGNAYSFDGGAGGDNAGSAGSAGDGAAANDPWVGAGGGGGGSSDTAGGGAGGGGGNYGAGGGGAGASTNGTAAGAGGDGGDGIVIVISY